MRKGLSRPLLILFTRERILYSVFSLQGEEYTELSLYLSFWAFIQDLGQVCA